MIPSPCKVSSQGIVPEDVFFSTPISAKDLRTLARKKVDIKRTKKGQNDYPARYLCVLGNYSTLNIGFLLYHFDDGASIIVPPTAVLVSFGPCLQSRGFIIPLPHRHTSTMAPPQPHGQIKRGGAADDYELGFTPGGTLPGFSQVFRFSPGHTENTILY